MPGSLLMMSNLFPKTLSSAAVLMSLLGTVLLSACITTSDVEDRWGYTCIDGYEFTATYAKNGRSVVLQDAEQEVKLKKLASTTSGDRYSDGSMDLWSEGALAYIKVNDEVTHPDCTGSSL